MQDVGHLEANVYDLRYQFDCYFIQVHVLYYTESSLVMTSFFLSGYILYTIKIAWTNKLTSSFCKIRSSLN